MRSKSKRERVGIAEIAFLTQGVRRDWTPIVMNHRRGPAEFQNSIPQSPRSRVLRTRLLTSAIPSGVRPFPPVESRTHLSSSRKHLMPRLDWWLYGWNSLPEDLDLAISELTSDPEERLARGPIEVPRIGISRPLAFLLVVTGWLTFELIDSWGRQDAMAQRFVILSPIALFLFAWGFFRLFSVRRLRMTIDRDGVSIADSKGTISCPWNLFNFECSIKRGGVPHRIQFAINPDEIPEVRMTRPDGTVVEGEAASNGFFKFGQHGTVHLAAFFALHPIELVRLLIATGQAIGPLRHENEQPALHPSHRTTFPPHRPNIEPSQSAPRARFRGHATINESGWLIASHIHWQPLPVCCLCGEDTDATYVIPAVSRYLGYFEGPMEWTHIGCCPHCRKTLWRREWLGRGTICLGSLSVPLLALMWLVGPVNFVPALFKHTLIICFFGGLIALLLFQTFIRFGRELFIPIRSRYRPRDETVLFRFPRPGYAQRALEWMQQS